MLDAFLDIVLPPVCLACDRGIASDDSARLVCRRCRTLLRAPPPPLCARCGAPRLQTGRAVDAASCPECVQWPPEIIWGRCAFLMHPPADRIVHQIKYRGWRVLAPPMAESIVAAIRIGGLITSDSIIVPVPTTRTRERERGYNQAELLAREVAEQLHCPCESLLERTSSTSTQTTLQPAARGANVAGAFRLRENAEERTSKANIIIVDDVLTTGATILECTRTLVGAGAGTIAVLTYARAFDTRRLLAG